MRFLTSLAVFLVLALATHSVFAAEIDEIKQQIDERNQKIKDLEAEIAQYERDLTATTQEKQTLQGAIKELDLTRKKLTANISLTQTRIAAKDAEIAGLSEDISDTSGRIDRQLGGVAKTIRTLAELDREPLSLAILSNDSFSAVFDDIAAAVALRTNLEDQIEELRGLKVNLEDTRTDAQKKRKELAALKLDLTAQQKALDANRAEKNALLKATQSKESEYQKILADKQKQFEAFQQEIRDLENQLQIAIDPTSIPKAGSGVLTWPFEPSYFAKCPSFQAALKNPYCLTQYFGNTPFATQNPQIYNNNGHNGVDFRAPVGTRITSALSGVVKGTGDTDAQRGCYSYGKWVLVEHSNGLSTLYAHLSSILVSSGQSVSTGQIVGYSGNTGYSTGPHLHFTVYATQGVQIAQFARSINCKNVSIPIADPKAYLNPLSFL